MESIFPVEKNTANSIPRSTSVFNAAGTYAGKWIGYSLYDSTEYSNVHLFNEHGVEYTDILKLANVDDSRMHYFDIHKVVLDAGFASVIELPISNI